MGTTELNVGVALQLTSIQGGVEIFLVVSCHRNPDKLQPDGPLGSYADYSIPFTHNTGVHNLQFRHKNAQ